MKPFFEERREEGIEGGTLREERREGGREGGEGRGGTPRDAGRAGGKIVAIPNFFPKIPDVSPNIPDFPPNRISYRIFSKESKPYQFFVQNPVESTRLFSSVLWSVRMHSN